MAGAAQLLVVVVVDAKAAIISNSVQSKCPTRFRPFSCQDDCDRDFFMTPEEAMDYGLIDEVVTTKTSHIPKPAMPSLEEVF